MAPLMKDGEPRSFVGVRVDGGLEVEEAEEEEDGKEDMPASVVVVEVVAIVLFYRPAKNVKIEKPAKTRKIYD
jgi:hypothetical protein